jgi:hypothetical protein
MRYLPEDLPEIRRRSVREKSKDRILPALYEDNYVTLMPGETRTLRTELEHADTRGGGFECSGTEMHQNQRGVKP